MRRSLLSAALAASSLVLCAGCDAARRVYYAAAYRTARVPTEAMLPTIKLGDYISIDENYYSKHPVQRFDIVAFRLPPENVPPAVSGVAPNTVYVKRVIGLGGETLEIKGGKVYINGRALEEPFPSVPLGAGDKFGPVGIPEGELFLLGDNRQDSLDSRYWRRPTLRGQYVSGKVIEIFRG
jgi:signal peptidase I